MLDGAGSVRDLSGTVADITPDMLAPAGLARLRGVNLESLPVVGEPGRIGVPYAGVGKFLCVGLNYSDHAAEAGMAVPAEPILFTKWSNALTGPNDPIVMPRGAKKTDWEVELGIVIGSRARYVSMERALDYVAGYCVVNDISEREYQLERGGTWDKGKGFDTFGPVGPWLVTTDEITDPQSLEMWLEVNGRRFQNGNTRTMIFGAAHLVHYISQFTTLEPGDLIATGTPPGVGMGCTPPVFLRAGDLLRLGIGGLGEQEQHVHEYDASLLD
jgi:2,4-diketo-3-deoxy-L-fuconate hydrolase